MLWLSTWDGRQSVILKSAVLAMVCSIRSEWTTPVLINKALLALFTFQPRHIGGWCDQHSSDQSWSIQWLRRCVHLYVGRVGTARLPISCNILRLQPFVSPQVGAGGLTVRHWTCDHLGRGFESHSNLRQVVHTDVVLSPSSITWYWSKDGGVLRLRRWPLAWQKVISAYCQWMT